MTPEETLQSALSELEAIKTNWKRAEEVRGSKLQQLAEAKAEYLKLFREVYNEYRSDSDPPPETIYLDSADDDEPLERLVMGAIVRVIRKGTRNESETDRIWDMARPPLESAYRKYLLLWQEVIAQQEFLVPYETGSIPCHKYIKLLRRDYGKWVKKWRGLLAGVNRVPELLPGAGGVEIQLLRPENEDVDGKSEPRIEPIYESRLREKGQESDSDSSISAQNIQRMGNAGVVPAPRNLKVPDEFHYSGQGILEPVYKFESVGTSFRHRPQETPKGRSGGRWPPQEIARAYKEKAGEVFDAMTNRQRQVFSDYYIKGLSMKEIAEQTGTTEPKISELMARIDKLYDERGLPLPLHSRPAPRVASQVEPHD